MSARLLLLVALIAALGACEPSPCDALVEAWMTCFCEGAAPNTTRPQGSIDTACASPEAFLEPPHSPVPDPERAALQRCDDPDATWATERLELSECREGGALVCGGSSAADACMPP